MRNKKVVEINNFNNFDSNSNEIKTKLFYNFLPTTQLTNTHGIAVATFPLNYKNKNEKELNISATGISSVQGVSYFKQYFPQNDKTKHRLLVYGNDKKIYINQMLDDTYDLIWLYDLEFNSAPITLSFKKDDTDTIILASSDEMKIWQTNYSPYTIENVPIITSMCMNEGVLFCTIKEPAFKVWYATDLKPENVGHISRNSGYISLEDDLGYARKIITFNEEVYVFRDYGISKINFVKDEKMVSQVYLSNTKIYTNTVCVCGNSVLFMTKDGVYSFNGIKVNKTKIEFINSLPVENNGAVASTLGEKYYLALKVNFEDQKQILCEESEFVNNALVIVDTKDFSYEIIRGVDVQSFLPLKTEVFEKMLITFNSGPIDKIGQIVEVAKYMSENLPKFWSSDSLFDTVNTKLVTKLSVKANKNIKFTLKYDNKEISFVTYKDGVNDFMFKLCCKDMKIEISSSDESSIVKNVFLDYYEY